MVSRIQRMTLSHLHHAFPSHSPPSPPGILLNVLLSCLLVCGLQNLVKSRPQVWVGGDSVNQGWFSCAYIIEENGTHPLKTINCQWENWDFMSSFPSNDEDVMAQSRQLITCCYCHCLMMPRLTLKLQSG